MRTRTLFSGLVAVVCLAAFGCSSVTDGSGEASADVKSESLAFHASADALPDFKYDTGLVPAASPAQVQMKLSAAGGLSIDAEGMRQDGKIAGKPGSGKAKIDIHVGMEGRLKVDSTFKSYDGELPGLKDVNIAIAGETPFDPFLTGDGEAATVTADIPEADLPPIPLGSVPGSLKLHIAKGSKLTSTFHGTCMSVSGGKASYAGEAKTKGTLVISATIALDLPKPLDKAIDLPPIPIAIPETTIKLDAGSIDAAGIADATEGSCGGTDPKPASGGSSSGGTSSGGPSNTNPVAPSGALGGTALVVIDGVEQKAIKAGNAMISPDGKAILVDLVEKPIDADTYTQPTFFLSLERTGTGCGKFDTNGMHQSAAWMPVAGGSTGYTRYDSAETADCGLTVTAADLNGGHVAGIFSGDMTLSQGPTGTKSTVKVSVSFDIPVKK